MTIDERLEGLEARIDKTAQAFSDIQLVVQKTESSINQSLLKQESNDVKLNDLFSKIEIDHESGRRRLRTLFVGMMFVLLFAASYSIMNSFFMLRNERAVLDASLARVAALVEKVQQIDAKLTSLQTSFAESPSEATYANLLSLAAEVENIKKNILMSPTDVVSLASLRADLESYKTISRERFAVIDRDSDRTITLLIGSFGTLMIAVLAALVLRP